MMGHSEYDLIIEAIRVLFLVIFPVIIAVAMAGLVVGSLQAATTIYDVAIGYAARMGAAALVLYIFYPTVSQAVMGLAQRAFK